MSTVRTNNILDAAGGNTATINGMTPTAQSLQGFRNRIINGGMVIDQRNNGAIYNPPPNQGYALDRWTTWLSQNTFSVQRNAGNVTPPAGFTNYLGITATSATTIGVGDYFGVGQKIEGFNLSDLAWGTASAQSATISFWVRSSLTGNFGAVIRRGDGGQYYAFTYPISAANTWEYKTVVVPGPTTGTWDSTNGTGLFLLFGLGAGTNQTASSNNTWINGGVLGASGATPVVATNGATFYITGVQLEAGSVATPFERRDYGRELIMCQRYFEKSFNTETAPANGVVSADRKQGIAFGVDRIGYYGVFSVTKRANPTVTFYNGANTGTAGQWAYYDTASTTWIASTGYSGSTLRQKDFSIDMNVSGRSANQALILDGNWIASAEL